MTIHELKKELGLSNKDIAEFFGLTPAAYANSSAKTRYENALCLFFEFLKEELTKLIESLDKGDIVVVYKLDRLVRSMTDLVNITNTIHSKKADLISLLDKFDTTTAQGKLMFNILGSFAQFERDLISERTKAALKELKTQGVRLGRPLWMSEASKAKIKEAKKLRKLHYTVEFICNQLNISRRTCYKYLNT